MTSRAATIRNAVINAIESARASYPLVVPGFVMTLPGGTHTGEASDFHLPIQPLVDLTTDGRVWVIAGVGDQDPPQTRNFSCIESVPVQVCYQCKVTNLSDPDFLDTRIELCEQLKRVVRKLVSDEYTWMKTEAEKDENGVPYAYRIMKDDSVFMCAFTAYYNTFLTDEE